LKWLETALKEDRSEEVEYTDTQRNQLATQFEQMEKHLEAIYEDKLDGKITPQFYVKKFSE
jgi:hypothetical protein